MYINQYVNDPFDQSEAIKRLPNPQNYKIVKCKNFDSGNLTYNYQKAAVNMVIHVLSLTVKLN